MLLKISDFFFGKFRLNVRIQFIQITENSIRSAQSYALRELFCMLKPSFLMMINVFSHTFLSRHCSFFQKQEMRT